MSLVDRLVLSIIERCLYLLAKIYLARTHPTVIAVGGAVGKTTTKDMVHWLLQASLPNIAIRRGYGNLNTATGLPLALLGFERIPLGRGLIKVFPQALVKALLAPPVRYAVLEYGVDQPGDMDHLTRMIPPNVAVVTRIGLEHTEMLGDLDGVYKEETKLMTHLKPHGIGIIPDDDTRLKNIFVPRRLTYGLDKNSDVRVTKYQTSLQGTDLTIEFGRTKLQLHSPLIGVDQNRAVVAAVAVLDALNIEPANLQAALDSFHPMPGRLRPVPGKKGLDLIDDSYNASPASMEAALQVLNEVAGKRRRVAILGEMRELGDLAESAHRDLGSKLAGVDLAILVGPWVKVTKEAAVAAGMDENQVITFAKTDQAINKLPSILKKGDVVLIKASQNKMRFERITEALMKNPQDAPTLLVRQSEFWKRIK